MWKLSGYALVMIGFMAMAGTVAAAGSNLTPNGNFSNGDKGWTIWPRGSKVLEHDATGGRDGTGAVFLHGAGSKSSGTIYTYAKLTPLRVYSLEVGYKPAFKRTAGGAKFGVRLHFNKKDGGNGSAGQLKIDLPTAEGSNAWQRHRTVFVAPAEAVKAQLVLGVQAAQGGVWIDEVKLSDATEAAILRVKDAPIIDGKLEDAVWKAAEPLEGFWRSDRATSQASMETTVWMAYDDENLYIAIRNDEPHMDQLRAQVKERDGSVWNDDCDEIFLMPPEGNGAHLAINSLNTQADLSMVRDSTEDVHQDKLWNGQWQSAVSRQKDGWTVELKIPFAMLKAAPKGGGTWRINLCRERYTGLPAFTQWNRTTGGFANVEKFATLSFGNGRAKLVRFVEDLSRNPLAVDRPDAKYESLLGDEPGGYRVSAWSSDMYLGNYPASYKKKYTNETWRPRAYEFLKAWGEAGMDGPAFPWAPMRRNLGWEMVEKLHEQFGMKYRLVILNSSLDRKAKEEGAKWVYPGKGRQRVAIVDPKLLEAIESFAKQWVGENPRAIPLIEWVEGIDEPSNGVFDTFSPTKRPEMKEAFAQLDGEIRRDFGHGQYGLFDESAPADAQTPFRRIAFLKWWNHNLGESIGRLQAFFKALLPDQAFMGFDVNATSSLNPTDVTLPSKYSDWVSTDPYLTKTLAMYGRGRALFHTGFTTKLVKDLSGGRPLRVICQGFIYYGGTPTPSDVREWASQALKNGANGLMWYETGPAILTIPEAYHETIRVNRMVHRMKKLELPTKTRTAIFFSQVDRWGRTDKPMSAAYSLYALLGERLGAWFHFVSDTQLLLDGKALDDDKLIYVPNLTYVDREAARRLIERARAGATLVMFDPKAFTWGSDGTRLEALRKSAGGTALGAAREDVKLLTADHGELPLTPRAIGVDKGKVEAFALGRLPDGAKVVATYADGTPAAYRVAVGKGSVIWFAAQPFGNSDLVLEKNGWIEWLGRLEQQAGEPMGLPIWHFLIPEGK